MKISHHRISPFPKGTFNIRFNFIYYLNRNDLYTYILKFFFFVISEELNSFLLN